MAISAFLQLEGIRGESRTAPCVGWIPLESVSTPVAKSSRPPEVVVVAPHGVHSTYLVRAMTNGAPFKQGEIAHVKDGSKYLVLKMEDVHVAALQFSGASSGVPLEMITLAPGKLTTAFG